MLTEPQASLAWLADISPGNGLFLSASHALEPREHEAVSSVVIAGQDLPAGLVKEGNPTA